MHYAEVASKSVVLILMPTDKIPFLDHPIHTLEIISLKKNETTQTRVRAQISHVQA